MGNSQELRKFYLYFRDSKGKVRAAELKSKTLETAIAFIKHGRNDIEMAMEGIRIKQESAILILLKGGKV